MTYSEAAKIVQDYTKEPLLESLELLRDRVEDPDYTIARKDVRVAYYTLMAGFTELMG